MPRFQTPLTIKNLPARYDVLRQKQSLIEDVGFFKIVGRGIKNLGLNNPVPREANTLAEIGHFLSKHENTKSDDIEVYDLNKTTNAFNPRTKAKTLHFPKTKDYYHLYHDKLTQQYYLWIPDHLHRRYKMVRVNANDDRIFKKKIFDILNSDTSKAKLECKTFNHILGKMPFVPGTEIVYDEHKLVGAYSENAYTRIGEPYQHDAFDTKIGAVDSQQLAYYLPFQKFQHYSNRVDDAVKIRDDTWGKMHAGSIFTDFGTEMDEIVGNIILQTYSGQNLTPEAIAIMGKKIKDDYVYDTYGDHSRAGKVRTHALPLFKLKPGKYGTAWQFGNNPFKGNRGWQETAMSHSELVKTLYEPQADGSALFLYDKDPEKFMALASKFEIKPMDRQYLASYGRKAIGARILLNYVIDELSKININDPNLSPTERSKAQAKQLDLTRFHGKVFQSLGDLKDNFRKSCMGFTAYARAVGQEEIPDIKEDKGHNRQTDGIPSAEGFVKSAKTALGNYVEDYAYFDSFWGWQGREYIGRALFNMFKNKVFEKEIPDIVADNAVAIIANTVDRSSRRMKAQSEFYLKDADLSSNTKAFMMRAKRLDLGGLSEIWKQQRSNLTEFFEGRKSYARTNVKRMVLQNEGVSHNREIWPKLKLRYRGSERGRWNANVVAHIVSWNKGEKVAGELLPLVIDIARIMKAHQKSLKVKGIRSNDSANYQKNDFVYKTPEMIELNNYLRKSADLLTAEYFQINKDVFATSPKDDLKVLNRQIRKEYLNVLNTIVNVVSMVSYTDEDTALGVTVQKSASPVN